MLNSLELQAVTVADSAGARGLQVEERITGAGVDSLVLTQVETEESPQGGAAGRQQESVG